MVLDKLPKGHGNVDSFINCTCLVQFVSRPFVIWNAGVFIDGHGVLLPRRVIVKPAERSDNINDTLARTVELSVASGMRYGRVESAWKGYHANSFTITVSHVTVAWTSNRINNFLLMDPHRNYNPLLFTSRYDCY